MQEIPLTFRNRNGNILFGIVHVPQNPAFGKRRYGINLTNPGIKYRIAPHRMNVKLARELCSQGYYVMRFDPEGIGDSEGELPENMEVADIWEKIQSGLLVDDTIRANDYFISEYGITDLTLIGNCGGAITALLAAAKDKRVNKLCLVDIPIYLWNSTRTIADTAVQGGKKFDWLFSEYIKRIFRLSSWYRFISMKTDYRSLKRVLIEQIKKRLPATKNSGLLPNNLEKLCGEGKLNRLFFESFRTVAENRKETLFILAGNDPGIEVFQTFFQNGYLKDMQKFAGLDTFISIFVIPDANHIYTLNEWQSALTGKVSEWLMLNNAIKTISRKTAMSSEEADFMIRP